MLTIKRVAFDHYQLEDAGGNVLAEYDTVGMEHPTDWEDDAINAGVDSYKIARGQWQYVDDRD